MPSNRVVETAYVGPFSSIDQVNASTNYKPGELGIRAAIQNKEYQYVQLDTGVLSNATQGQVVYWKDAANYVVTNNNLFANNTGGTSAARNFVAGIITPTAGVTAGYFTYIQQKGPNAALKSDSVTTAVGDWIVASATTGNVTNASATLGTACPVQNLGVFTAVATGTTQTGYLKIDGDV